MKASWTYHPRALTKVLFWYSHQNRPICCMMSKKTYENRTVQYAIYAGGVTSMQSEERNRMQARPFDKSYAAV